MSTRVLPFLIETAREIDGVDLSDAGSNRQTLESASLPASASSTPKKGTFSFWYERTTDNDAFFGPQLVSAGGVQVAWHLQSGALTIVYVDAAFTRAAALRTTDDIFPNPSGPKHVVVVVDTTQAVATDRLRLFVDGVEITAFDLDQRDDTNIPQNDDCGWFGTSAGAVTHKWGAIPGLATNLDGIVGDLIGLDGIAETDPTAFTGALYSGPYGARGFHLDLSDPNDLGNDISGNNRHFSLINVDSTDHVDGWITP